ncbi:Trm112 family protein [Streptomyces sp. NPDC060194]|uniref:Trm112 family protein n=1 Tax=Streptomyces sp. NPDC060194 TaxID=3347069 RepID=UPI0036671E19
MKTDDPLLRILACPLDKGPLTLLDGGEALYNPRLRRRYAIVDGIPQLLPSSGEELTEEQHAELTAVPAAEGAGGGPGRAPGSGSGVGSTP